SLTMERGVDGETLHVATGTGTATDGVAVQAVDSTIFSDTETGTRRGADGLVETKAVEAPERRKGGMVDCEHGWTVAPAGPADRRGHRRRGERSQVVAEEMEALFHLEPGGEKAGLLQR